MTKTRDTRSEVLRLQRAVAFLEEEHERAAKRAAYYAAQLGEAREALAAAEIAHAEARAASGGAP